MNVIYVVKDLLNLVTYIDMSKRLKRAKKIQCIDTTIRFISEREYQFKAF